MTSDHGPVPDLGRTPVHGNGDVPTSWSVWTLAAGLPGKIVVIWDNAPATSPGGDGDAEELGIELVSYWL